MEAVTTREFRSNPTQFLAKAKAGNPEDILMENQLCAALDEVKAHIDGQIKLHNAKELVF
ncbi:MAG: hypothetical protein ACI3YT_03775 [Prevotella sp.]